jgi:type IV pilus assembly protein PilM
MGARGFGIDEGSATWKAVEVELKEGALVPVAAAALPTGEGSPDPAAVAALLKGSAIKSRQAVLGLTGKDLVIKYQQVPPVPDFQLKKIVAFELDEIRRQSGDALAADFNVMPSRADLTSDDIVLMALSREQRIEERLAALQQAGVATRHFTPNAVALFHSFRAFGPATSGDVLVVAIGKTSSDMALMRDGDLLYARSVGTGGDVLTDALASEFGVSKAKAESLKRELGDLRPRDKRSGLSQQSEKVSYALENAAGRLFSMVQSTVQLAKGQMQLNQLELSKVWITGGTAAMQGLDEYLAGSLGVPVQRFDPLGDAGVAVDGAGSLDLAVAAGLAVMAADPQAWSVELLTGGERRAREWKQKHLFTAAALLVVAVYLGIYAWQCQSRFEVADKAAVRLGGEQRKRTGNKDALERLRVERGELAAKVDQLEKRKAAGDSLVRALGLLSTTLPEDLWVTGLELELLEAKGTARDKVAKKPLIVVDGAGKSRGTRAADESFSAFVETVRGFGEKEDWKPVEFVEAPSQRDGQVAYRINMSWLGEPAMAKDDDAADAAESGAKGAAKPAPKEGR